ncbi:trans-sulfuration enzyme family protein [Bacillus subtilis]|nr:PLP-dependent aspartate aminotransferase family protein [Bacillus subtilis]
MTQMDTKLAQVGLSTDPNTGAVSPPIYHSATFANKGYGLTNDYYYSRVKNPTRTQLEDTIAELEGGAYGFAFASGMAATSAIMQLFVPGDHLIVSEDLYGGTHRLFTQILSRYEITTTFVDTADINKVKESIMPNTKGILIETPSNPMLRVTSLQEISDFCKKHNIISIVDNTFMTPYLQRPLNFGIDIVYHSGTKYIGGHNDVICGLVVVEREDIAEKLTFIQNTTGAVLGPQDCWLVLRGLKTLALRMDRQQENAQKLAESLLNHVAVSNVYYPGVAEKVVQKLQLSQSTGFGAMLSFELKNFNLVKSLIEGFELVTFAQSLGGTETMITHPVLETHADIPEEARLRLGITNGLLRVSV